MKKVGGRGSATGGDNCVKGDSVSLLKESNATPPKMYSDVEKIKNTMFIFFKGFENRDINNYQQSNLSKNILR